MLQHHKIVFTQYLCAHLNIVSPCLYYARRPKHVVLCLYVPKCMDVVQMKLFVSNKDTVTGYA